MAKFARDAVMDAALSTIMENVKLYSVCSGQPTDFDDGYSLKGAGGKALARVNTSAGTFSSIANGDSSGRKVHINTHSGIAVSATGLGNHVACLSSATASTLWYVTTASAQTLTSGNTLQINGWDVEIADPT